MESFFVSIIVPVYNNKDSLKKTIASLCEQTYPSNRYEIIVVDDGSTDSARDEFIDRCSEKKLHLKYLFQENKGPAAARNLGIRKSNGEIVAFIDSDCIAAKDWLKEIIAGYDDVRVAGIGGFIKAKPTTAIVSQYCAYIKMNERPKIDKTGIVYLITGNASFRKDYLTPVGCFDERYNFAGGEDPDLCYRLKKKGYIFRFNPKAIVFNAHKQTVVELAKTYFNYGKGESFLALRKGSKWSLARKINLVWFFYLLKTVAKMALMFITNLKFIIRFVKIPFKSLLYYTKGLNFKISLIFAFIEYVQAFSFQQGCFFGYFIGKFKDFKR